MFNLKKNNVNTLFYKAFFAIILSALIYGGNVIAGRLLAGRIPPFTLSAVRAILALVILLPASWPALKNAPKPNKKELLKLFIISILGVSSPYISFILGLSEASGTNASVIFATLPAVTNILLFLIYKIKPSKFQFWGIITSFLGLIIVFTQGNLLHLFSLRFGKGELFIFANVLSISLFNIAGQNIMKKFSPIVTSIYSISFAALTLTPVGLWQIHSFVWHLSWTGWLLVIYMGCFAAGIAYFLNLYGIQKIGSGRATIINNMQHIFSITLSVLILKEILTVYHFFGFFLVISGVILSLISSPIEAPRLIPKSPKQNISRL